MKPRDYWLEAVQTSFAEAGFSADANAIETIAGDMETCHENYGMAFYSPPAPVEKRERQLTEWDFMPCPDKCSGGRVYSRGPHHGSDSQCSTCHGAGVVRR